MSVDRESLPFSQIDWSALDRTRRQLALRFARSFDYSFVKSVCYAIRERRSQPGLEPLGEGAHFENFRLMTGKDVDLAIGLAKTNFHRYLKGAKRNWIGLMDQLSRMHHPMIPPFALIENDESCLAFVRPYCSQEEVQLEKVYSGNLALLKRSLLDELHRNQLDLDDYLQVRGIEGHPLVIDWSDLQALFGVTARGKVV